MSGPRPEAQVNHITLSTSIYAQVVDCRPTGNYPETLVLYRTGPAVSVPGDSGKSGGARPIQLFEGSRPWGSIYANSMVLGV